MGGGGRMMGGSAVCMAPLNQPEDGCNRRADTMDHHQRLNQPMRRLNQPTLRLHQPTLLHPTPDTPQLLQQLLELSALIPPSLHHPLVDHPLSLRNISTVQKERHSTPHQQYYRLPNGMDRPG